jgi:two-component system, LytTR family, sensor histidine kinase AlgZ
MGLYLGTLRALAAPARLGAIGLVTALLLVEQARFSRDPLALPIAAAMVLTFVLVGPASWRALFPGEGAGGSRDGRGGRLVRLGAYGAAGLAAVASTGVLLPAVLGVGPTFLTDAGSLPVATALFWVGGWGLGRDIDRHEGLEAARRRASELEREAERAELLALRSQLDPHFLFNTLNAIAEWCREDGEVAERAILTLSSMLRTMLEGVKKPGWPLSEELKLSSMLVELHAVRDPGATGLELATAGELEGATVLPMLILGLVENALKHGPSKGHRGVLRLSVRVEGGELVVELDNPGEYAGDRSGGQGLPSLRRRFSLAYGAGASFSIEGSGGRTKSRLRVPARVPE